MATLVTQKKWCILPSRRAQREAMGRAVGVHPMIAQLLINRGIDDAAAAADFLKSSEEQLHDPFLLKDMDKAIDRVRQAQRAGERVLIFGDYDVDGITASVVLRQILKRFGIDVINHIPDRMDDGYGLNEQVVDVAKQSGATLVISIDCGVTAVRAAAILKDHAIDLIVIDHHEPGEQGLPAAVAVIDPKRTDCTYPFKHLAAVGLAAKFAQAVVGRIPHDILDLVALGTVADVVPLCGENRVFVKLGLPYIAKTQNKGLQALLEASKTKGKTITPYYAGFILGPRINAAGRMGSAHRALDLLLSDDETEATRLALELEGINVKRQQLQRRIIQEAMEMMDANADWKRLPVIVLAKEGWHKGVLGIVASRMVETFYRPVVIASIEDGWGTASARSIDGFHLYEALTSCSGLLKEFGGHRLAAGLTVHQDQLASFQEQMNAYALKNMDESDLVPTLMIDADVDFSYWTPKFVSDLNVLQPYGEGNRPPVFCSKGVVIKSRPAALARETLKFWVSDGQQTLSAVGFGMARYQSLLQLGQKVNLAYEVDIDDWNKDPVVQLKLKDIQVDE